MVKRELSLTNEVRPLEITYANVEQVRLSEANPRRHSKAQLGQLRRSIQQFGFVQPILVDSALEVVAGNARLVAARDLGMPQVPVVQIGHLSEAERRAYAIADNKIALNAEWDEDQLMAELRALAELELDFDLEITGFETAELDLILIEDEEGEAAAEAVALPSRLRPAHTRSGDLWLCGPHRVFCGDATASQSYADVMQDDRADVVFTDPPYNVPVAGHVRGQAQGHREFAMASGEMSQAGFTDFLTTVFREMCAVSRDGALHYACMDWRHMQEMLTAGHDAYDSLINLCVWNKTNGGMGSFYRSKHELVFVWSTGAGPHLNTVELGKHGRYRTNVWDYAGVNVFGPDRDANLADHPTVKPTQMVLDAILDCSRRGHIVFDPFLGSGTTLLAAEQAGRVCRGIELDPHYVDVALRRWSALTGEMPVHAQTGAAWVDPELEPAKAGEFAA